MSRFKFSRMHVHRYWSSYGLDQILLQLQARSKDRITLRVDRHWLLQDSIQGPGKHVLRALWNMYGAARCLCGCCRVLPHRCAPLWACCEIHAIIWTAGHQRPLKASVCAVALTVSIHLDRWVNLARARGVLRDNVAAKKREHSYLTAPITAVASKAEALTTTIEIEPPFQIKTAGCSPSTVTPPLLGAPQPVLYARGVSPPWLAELCPHRGVPPPVGESNSTPLAPLRSEEFIEPEFPLRNRRV